MEFHPDVQLRHAKNNLKWNETELIQDPDLSGGS